MSGLWQARGWRRWLYEETIRLAASIGRLVRADRISTAPKKALHGFSGSEVTAPVATTYTWAIPGSYSQNAASLSFRLLHDRMPGQGQGQVCTEVTDGGEPVSVPQQLP
jgi:hypothetical protein